METMKVYAIKFIETVYDSSNGWKSSEVEWWYCFAGKGFVDEPAQKYILNPIKAQRVIDTYKEKQHSDYQLIVKSVKLED